MGLDNFVVLESNGILKQWWNMKGLKSQFEGASTDQSWIYNLTRVVNVIMGHVYIIWLY
jgi:hypothetical protein